MLNVSNTTIRYSDHDLVEFKNHIEQKIEETTQQLNLSLGRIENISETQGNDGDWMDDSSNNQDLEMLYGMVGRQRKHLRDLENAMIRIHNKNYGICVVTGQLIDKRRLMAVPTTYKSLEAKNALPEKPVKEEVENKMPPMPTGPASFTKIIKRTGVTAIAKPKVEEEISFDEADDLELDFENTTGVNVGEMPSDIPEYNN
jgi:DnaK suppressor protein